MTAVLCRHFGLQHMEIAEDIASDTFLKASEHWALHGIPENPVAWLYTVAKNKTKDHFKRNALFETKVKAAVDEQTFTLPEYEIDEKLIADSQLAMIFAVCDPANPKEAQIALALQILCGFSVEEIAQAFLTNRETLKKRLQRARTNLRQHHFRLDDVSETQMKARLDTVLQTLYLLFNEGYFSAMHDQSIRRELCAEAVHLCMVLVEHPATNLPKVHALLALLCFQSSRLDARTNDHGETILFEDQDKSLWDQALINKGNYHLVQACEGSEASKYHLEAGIAWWHTASDDQKWTGILQLYNELILLEYSPVTALNRTFAFAKVYGNAAAIREAEQLALPDNHYYQALMGYLYEDVDLPKAIAHYKDSVRLARSAAEKQTLSKAIARLANKKESHT